MKDSIFIPKTNFMNRPRAPYYLKDPMNGNSGWIREYDRALNRNDRQLRDIKKAWKSLTPFDLIKEAFRRIVDKITKR
jgi:hypothetical protein